MRDARVRVLLTLAAVVQCSSGFMTNAASAQTPDALSATADAGAEETSAPGEPPQFVEKQIIGKAPAPSY
jgi:hypothetical protein